MTDPIVRWEAPSARTKAAIFEERWQATAAALLKRPHSWAVIVEAGFSETNNLAQKVKKGVSPFGPQGAYEAVTRTHKSTGRVAVYARYIGGAAS